MHVKCQDLRRPTTDDRSFVSRRQSVVCLVFWLGRFREILMGLAIIRITWKKTEVEVASLITLNTSTIIPRPRIPPLVFSLQDPCQHPCSARNDSFLETNSFEKDISTRGKATKQPLDMQRFTSFIGATTTTTMVLLSLLTGRGRISWVCALIALGTTTICIGLEFTHLTCFAVYHFSVGKMTSLFFFSTF